jgi:hypothetical protein
MRYRDPSLRQEAGGRRQEAGGRRQEAGGRGEMYLTNSRNAILFLDIIGFIPFLFVSCLLCYDNNFSPF